MTIPLHCRLTGVSVDLRLVPVQTSMIPSISNMIYFVAFWNIWSFCSCLQLSISLSTTSTSRYLNIFLILFGMFYNSSTNAQTTYIHLSFDSDSYPIVYHSRYRNSTSLRSLPFSSICSSLMNELRSVSWMIMLRELRQGRQDYRLTDQASTISLTFRIWPHLSMLRLLWLIFLDEARDDMLLVYSWLMSILLQQRHLESWCSLSAIQRWLPPPKIITSIITGFWLRTYQLVLSIILTRSFRFFVQPLDVSHSLKLPWYTLCSVFMVSGGSDISVTFALNWLKYEYLSSTYFMQFSGAKSCFRGRLVACCWPSFGGITSRLKSSGFVRMKVLLFSTGLHKICVQLFMNCFSRGMPPFFMCY